MSTRYILGCSLASALLFACGGGGTSGPDTTPPGYPTGLSAARNGNAVEITWTNPSDDDLEGVLVLRQADLEPDVAPVTGQGYDVGDTIGAADVIFRGYESSTSFVDTPPGLGRWCYRVFVFDAAFNYTGSTSRCVDYDEPDTTPPSFGGLVSATGVSNTQIELVWAAGADDVSQPEELVYDVYQASTEAGLAFDTPAYTSDPGATSLTVFGLSPGTTYWFAVRARDRAGNRDGNQIARSGTTLSGADVTPPTFGGLVSATAMSPSRIDLSWGAAADDTSAPGAIVYDVYQATTPGGQTFGTPTYTTAAGATSLQVTGLTQATTYFFVVRARDEAGNQDANTAERMATTQTSTDVTAPTFTGLTAANVVSNSQITLTWSAASDDVSAAADIDYLIYQSTASGGQNYASPTYVTAPGATSFPVTGLTPSTTYYFVVRARDEAGNLDANTVERTATTLSGGDVTPPTFGGATTALAVSDTQILLSWAAATDNVTAAGSLVYLVYQSSTSGGQAFASPTYVTAPGATSFPVTGLTPNTPYYFVVRARDEAMNSDTNTVERSATTLATPDTTKPTFMGAASATAASSSAVDLTWSAASDNVTPQGSIVYDVYWATTSGGQSFAVPGASTSPGALTYRVNGLAASTTYYFVVRARDLAGNRDVNLVERSATTQVVDLTPPLVLSDNFATGSALVTGTASFVASVTFSEPVTGVNAPNVTIDHGATLGSFSTSDNLTFNFTASGLQDGTRYTVSFAQGIQDQSGNPLAPTSRQIYVASSVVYVRPGGAGNQTGTSPANALPLVSQALTVAAAGTDVYVQGGTYSDSITLVEGVNIYGGYDASFTVRDPVGNESLLTQGTFSTTVTAGAGVTTNTVIDGMAFGNTYGQTRYVLSISGGGGVTVRNSRLFLSDGGCHEQYVIFSATGMGTGNALVLERSTVAGGGLSNLACSRYTYGVYFDGPGSTARLDGNVISVGQNSATSTAGYTYRFYGVRLGCHTCELVNNVIDGNGAGPTNYRTSYGVYVATNSAFRKLVLANNTISGGAGYSRFAVYVAGGIDALYDVRLGNNVLFTSAAGGNSYLIYRDSTTGRFGRVQNNMLTSAAVYLYSGAGYTPVSAMETYLNSVGTTASFNKEVADVAALYFQDYAGRDWSPTASSPLGLTQGGMDTSGADWGSVTTDRLGNPRTSLYSIGAYEAD